MRETFLISFRLKTVYRVNMILFGIRQMVSKLPIFPHDVFGIRWIKTLAVMLAGIREVLDIFVGKLAFVGLMFAVIIGPAAALNITPDTSFLEEVQVPPHPVPDIMHRARLPPALRMRARKTRAGLESDRDVQFASAALPVTQLHTRNPPGIRQPQGGGEQQRGIHTPKLPASHLHPTSPPTPNSEKPNLLCCKSITNRLETLIFWGY